MVWYVENKQAWLFRKPASLQTEGGRYKRAVNTNQLGGNVIILAEIFSKKKNV